MTMPDNTPKTAGAPEAEVDISDCATRGTAAPHAHTYVVTIDNQKFKVNTSTPTGEFLLSLVGKRPCADELLAEYSHHEAQVVDPNTEVDLRAQGLKGFITAPKTVVTIFIDNNPYPIERGQRTVAEILAKVGKTPEGYMLMQDQGGGPVPLPIELPVQIVGCEEFFTQVQSGGSSHP